MALTSLDSIFTLNASEIAYFIKDGKAPSRGQKYPLYIPRLMPGITMGVPTTTKIATRGNSVFKNSPQCAIRADSTMISTNYLEATFEGNSKWTASQASIDPSKGTAMVTAGLKVTCHALTNVVEDMTFTNS